MSENSDDKTKSDEKKPPTICESGTCKYGEALKDINLLVESHRTCQISPHHAIFGIRDILKAAGK